MIRGTNNVLPQSYPDNWPRPTLEDVRRRPNRYILHDTEFHASVGKLAVISAAERVRLSLCGDEALRRGAGHTCAFASPFPWVVNVSNHLTNSQC